MSSPTSARRVKERGIHYSNGRRGPAGEIRAAAWSPDGTRVVFHKRVTFERKPWVKTWSRHPQYELTLTNGGPSFSPTGDRFAFVGQAQDAKGAGVTVATPGSETSQIVYRDPARNVLGPQWSPQRRPHHLRHRRLQCLLQRIPRSLPEAGGSRRGRRAGGDRQPRWQRVPRADQRTEQQRIPVDGAGRTPVRLPDVRTGRRRPSHHGHRDEAGDADRGRLRQLPAMVAARRPDHVLATGRGRLRDLHDQAGRHRPQAGDAQPRQRLPHGLVA